MTEYKPRYFWATPGWSEGPFDTIDDVIKNIEEEKPELGPIYICQQTEEFDYEDAAKDVTSSLMDRFTEIYEDFQGCVDDDTVHFDESFRPEVEMFLLKVLKEKTDFSTHYKGVALFEYNLDKHEKHAILDL